MNVALVVDHTVSYVTASAYCTRIYT